MFDIFYSGVKPNLFVHEREARDIEHARSLSRTRYFWWVNYLTDYTGFDFLFEPVPWQAEYTHTWPSQWHEYSGTYLVPRNNPEIRYYFNQQILPNKIIEQNYNQLKDNILFDYSWAPHPLDPPFDYVFGNQWYPANRMPTVEYRVPGATETKYIFTPRAELLSEPDDNWRTLIECEFDYSWIPDPGDTAYIYVFGNQWWPATKMPTVEYHVPGATERKYMPYPRANLNVNMAHWTIPDRVDISTFDFSWQPDPGDPPYRYQFGTQHQRTGGPQYHVAGATETKYIDQIRIRTERVATAIYEIDHLDGNTGQIADVFRTVRYFDNYLDTLKRIAKSAPDDQEFVWICSSICDYTEFDFTWHPEVWQAGMLHVFPSDGQKFGDTFFMHVPTFRYRADKLQLLDWYDINYMDKSVPRRPLPVIQHAFDTHVAAVKQIDFDGPLAIFTTQDNQDYNIPAVPLWREKTKTIVPLSAGASTIIIPKTCVPYIKKQLYDYPNIDRTQRHMYTDNLLDIVFIDNGEPNAEDNYLYLKWAAERANTIQIHRSSGVNGRVAAYRAAAELSTTPWFFAVFAKLEVSSTFDWRWQPDKCQEPKHYIFHAYNPVNGLEYGHQAMIAYNKQLVLENTAPGLDFTLDQAHEVVPIISGVANYHYSKWVAWRTAFREAIKLKHSLPNVENQYRLTRWLTPVNTVENSEYSVWGAEDAVEYYDSVAGDFAELRKSYDWAWLASYALIKRNLTPNQ
jgi:hypothetical protein